MVVRVLAPRGRRVAARRLRRRRTTSSRRTSTDVGDDDDAAARSKERRPSRRSATSPITETALLTDVRGARHAGFDRVVFEFRNGVPGYEVGYVERPIRRGRLRREVAVAGGAVLVVRMEPALDADLTQEAAPRTYTGPARFCTRRGRGRRARPHRRIRGRPHLGGRCRREAAVPRHAARRSGPDRDRHRHRVDTGGRGGASPCGDRGRLGVVDRDLALSQASC